VQATGSTVLMVTHDVDEAVLLSDRIVMLTNGPAATIGEILTVPLPPVREQPRARLEMAHNSQYLAARESVLEFLYRKQAHVEAKAA
jgi:nitrate/nitrite transport system ATP-binding protein